MVANVSARDAATGLCRTTDTFRMAARRQEHAWRLLYPDAPSQSPLASATDAGPVTGLSDDLAHIRYSATRRRHHLNFPGFTSWVQEVSERSGFHDTSLTRWFDRLMDHFLSYRNAFLSIIDRRRPAAFVLTDHGDPLTAAICSSASQFGVPVHCIQHGMLRRSDVEHPLHPCPAQRPSTTPDHHWLWHKQGLYKTDRTIGPPSIMLAMDMIDPIKCSGSGTASQTTPTILLAAQSPADIPRFKQYVRTLTPSIKSKARFLWRPHPRFANYAEHNLAAIAALREENVAHVETDRALLLDSLLRANLIVTRYSAVGLEAASMGVQVQFLSKYADWSAAGQIDVAVGKMNFEELAGEMGKDTISKFRAWAAPLRDATTNDLL